MLHIGFIMHSQEVAIGARNSFLLCQAQHIVSHWFYKVSQSTVFVRDVLPWHRWLRVVDPGGGELVFHWFYKGSLAELAVPEGEEAAIGHFHRM